MKADTLKTVLRSSNVRRFHVHPIIGEQNIAHHSWRLVMLIYYAVSNPSPALIKAALIHDVPEILTGDSPYTAKALSLDLKRALDAMENRFLEDNELNIELFENEKQYLKICDMLELVWFCREQIDLGNKNLSAMFELAQGIVIKALQNPELDSYFKTKIQEVLVQVTNNKEGSVYE